MTAIAAPTILKQVPGPGELKKIMYVAICTASSDTYDASGDFTTIYQIRSVASTDADTTVANTVSGTDITFAGHASGTETHYVEVTGV